MFELDRIFGFEWDDGNKTKSFDKHGVTQEEAEQVFDDELLLVFRDVLHSDEEERYHALGQAKNGRLLSVFFTLRRDRCFVRIISARPMDARERGCYD